MQPKNVPVWLVAMIIEQNRMDKRVRLLDEYLSNPQNQVGQK